MMLSPTKEQLLEFYDDMTKGHIVKVESFMLEHPLVVHQRFNSRPLIENTHLEMHPHHVAVIHDQPEILERILLRQPDLESLDIQGKTALHYVVECGSRRINPESYLEMMEMLLKSGADVEGRASKTHRSPLVEATNPIWAAGAIILLKYGADPTQKTWNKSSPLAQLHGAAKNNPSLAEALNTAAMKVLGNEVNKGTIERVRVMPKIKLKSPK